MSSSRPLSPPKTAGSTGSQRAYGNEALYADCERRATRPYKITADVMERVFDGVCKQIQLSLATGRGVNIAGLGKFTLRLEKRDMGTRGVVEHAFPIFIPVEVFLRANDLRVTQKGAARSLAPTAEVNIAQLCQDLELRKEIVTNSIKTIVEVLGSAIGTGTVVDINWLCGRMLADRKILHFHWFGSSLSNAGTAPGSAMPKTPLSPQQRPRTGDPNTLMALPPNGGIHHNGVDILTIEHTNPPSPTAQPQPSHSNSNTLLPPPSSHGHSLHGAGAAYAEHSKFRPASPHTPSMVSLMPFSDKGSGSKAISNANAMLLESPMLNPRQVPPRMGYISSDAAPPMVTDGFDGGNIANQRTLRRTDPIYLDELSDDDPRKIQMIEAELVRRANVKYAKYKGTRDSLFEIQHAAEMVHKMNESEISSPKQSLSSTLGAMPVAPEAYRALAASPSEAFASMAINVPPTSRLQNTMAEAADRYTKELEKRRTEEDGAYLQFEAQVANARRLASVQREEQRLEMLEMRKTLQKQMEEAKERKSREDGFVRSRDEPPFPRAQSYVTRDQVLQQQEVMRKALDAQMTERDRAKRVQDEEQRMYQKQMSERAARELEQEKVETQRRKEHTTQTLTDAWQKQRDFAKREAFVNRHSSPNRELKHRLDG